jgi:hypothetical protein
VSLPVSSKSIQSSRLLDLGAAVAVGVVGELLVALASAPPRQPYPLELVI